MFLVPTFAPPSTSIGRHESQHDRLARLLNQPHCCSKNRSTPPAQLVQPLQPAPVKRKADVLEGHDSFTLFEGTIVVDSKVQEVGIKQTDTSAQHPPKDRVTKSVSRIDYGQLSELLDERAPVLKPASKGPKPAPTRGTTMAKTAGAERVSRPSPASESSPNDDLFAITDFVGIERCCRNAGASVDALRALINKVSRAQTVACAVVWKCLSTTHAPTTLKFCTHSSTCTHWNCTCDRHVRGHYLAQNAVGVIFHLPGEEAAVYFVPLLHCKGTAQSQSQSSNRPGAASARALPMQCGSTLEERLSAVAEIFSSADVVKVMYNAQLALIPLLQMLGNHLASLHQRPFTLAMVSNITDPRVAAYLLDSDIAEAQLELLTLFDQYRVLADSPTESSAWASSTSETERASAAAQLATDLSTMGRFARMVHGVKDELRRLVALQSTLQARLTAANLLRIHQEIEMPVACLLAQMELTGVEVDVTFLDSMRVTLAERIHATEVQIFAAVSSSSTGAGTSQISGGSVSEVVSGSFNVSSPEQVARVLYEVLALPPPAQTSKKGRHHSTSEEDLLRIRHLHPVVGLILDYRALSKLQSTYVDGLRPFLRAEGAELQALLHPATAQTAPSAVTIGTSQAAATADAFGVLMQTARSTSAAERLEHPQRIHANWQHAAVRTGRLSCVKPNLQNIPNTQTTGGVEIRMRSAFRASKGCVLVSADYSQIEIRVLAHLCRDPVLLELFCAEQDYDIYRQLAGKIFARAPAAVSDEERDRAKVICLGVLYGMGPQAAAAKLGIEVAQASRITQTFFDHFRQMRAWIQQIKSQAKQYGLVRTLLGRIRRLADIHSEDSAKASYAERQAVNSVIQGTASDIIKYAMANVDRALSQRWPADLPTPRLVMQIHDELIYEVGSDARCLLELTQLLRSAMEEEVVAELRLSVPLVVKVHSGAEWGNLT